MTRPAGALLDEIGYLAAVLHWPLDTLLDLEHPDREHFLRVARDLTAGGVDDDEEDD